jgi:hypothetical protein
MIGSLAKSSGSDSDSRVLGERRRHTTATPPLRIAPAKPARRPAMTIVSVLLVAACSGVFGLIYVHASRLVAVLGIAQEVSQGQPLEPGDLHEVDVGLMSGVSTIPVADADQVMGKPAAVPLLAGTLLARADVEETSAIPSDSAIVGVDVKPGMFPASGVEPGESVLVVLTAPPGSSLSTQGTSGANGSESGQGQSVDSPSAIGTATVVSVNESPGDSSEGDIVVSLEIGSSIAPLVADASATGQAALIEVGPSS